MRLLVTAGPTREFLDPVRFLSNPSSGRMGIEIACAAAAMGHDVLLVHGPCTIPIPQHPRIRLIPVITAIQMRMAVRANLRGIDAVVMAAAVSDFRARSPRKQKVKKNSAGLHKLQLVQNPDILKELGAMRSRPLLVGFCAETHHLLKHAEEKLQGKNLDMIVANIVGGRRSAFEASTNEVVVLDRSDGVLRYPRMSKKKLAEKLMHKICITLERRKLFS